VRAPPQKATGQRPGPPARTAGPPTAGGGVTCTGRRRVKSGRATLCGGVVWFGRRPERKRNSRPEEVRRASFSCGAPGVRPPAQRAEVRRRRSLPPTRRGKRGTGRRRPFFVAAAGAVFLRRPERVPSLRRTGRLTVSDDRAAWTGARLSCRAGPRPRLSPGRHRAGVSVRAPGR